MDYLPLTELEIHIEKDKEGRGEGKEEREKYIFLWYFSQDEMASELFREYSSVKKHKRQPKIREEKERGRRKMVRTFMEMMESVAN